MITDPLQLPAHLSDKHGTIYRLVVVHADVSYLRIEVHLEMPWSNKRQIFAKVGYANLRINVSNKEIRIMDFRIDDNAFVPPSGMRRLLRRLTPLRFSWPRQNFRNLGLGSALLAAIIETSKACGFERITGELSPNDLAQFAKLPDWYKRHGFMIAGKNLLLEV